MSNKNMNECVFCKIIKGEYPYSKVYEDNNLLAFMDTKPVNKGHTLIIPKKHYKLISEMDELITGELFIAGNQIASAIRRSGIKCEGINFFLADGKAAGQGISHVHLHINPRFKNDGFGFIYPEGYGEKVERKELNEIAKKINSFL